MQYKFLLAGVFMFFTSALNDPFQLSKELSENISLHIKKPGAPFWELGKKNDPATDTASLKQSNWYGEAMKNIAASEYHFEWEEKLNAYCTPNRKNNLRFFYDENGFSVEPRTTQIPIGDLNPLKRPDEIKYKQLPDWKINFNLDKKQVSNGKWQIVNNKAEYVTENITVQYINNEEGMRQNFIVQKPLSKKDELKINFSIKTKLKIALQNKQIKFMHKKGGNVLDYADLKVWDADQKPLEAGFVKNEEGDYAIKVNTTEAVYPITIDPISTIPAAIIESNQVSAFLGVSVASAGDVNGDGYSDVIVGAPQYDNGQTNEGAAFVYHGSATGINTTATAMVESNQAGAQMGFAVASAGDVNGDGFSDVIVGAYYYDNGQTDEGAAFVYHGSAIGINTAAAATVESNQAFAQMGVSVASAGDVNGDGYSDVIVGAFQYDNGQTQEGAAFVYHGSATGINTIAAVTVESNQANAYMGVSVASAGDVNGDGYSDVIVGAYFYSNGQVSEGAAFVYHGSATGINTTATATVESNQGSARMGYSVASAGDVNGDGYSDVIVGVLGFYNGQTDEGAAFVYHGSATGINTIAAATVESNQATALMGRSVASAGDVNGDGYSDVIVGAFQYDNGQTDEGAAFVYHGAAGGLISSSNILNPPVAQVQCGYGNAVASAGDVNGDGYSDVIIGANGYDDGTTDEGRAFVYYGSATGLPASPNVILDDANQAAANFGGAVACAGDVNGDGYSDVVVGAFLYDGGNTDEGRAWVYHGSAGGLSNTPARILDDANQNGAGFGIHVSDAGDINGDGYGDIIIGAYSYDDGINTNEGRAYVYYGSAAGIPATASLTLSTDANQPNANFGRWVASAGDVDGDGYNDLLVSATNYDGNGAVFYYFGSSAGLIAAGILINNASQPGELFGFPAVGAGDLNGDGYSDMALSGIFYNSQKGRVYVYYGSPLGLPLIPDLVLENTQVGNNNGDRMGYGLSSAGDVNGDGYSDIVVGVPEYDNGANSNAGRVFVYYGSSTGLPSSPNVVLSDANQANEFYGGSVASAGDINGDGYSDVIIGADHGSYATVGRAFVYYGNYGGGKRNNLRLYNQNLTSPISHVNVTEPNLFGAGLFAKSPLGRVKGKLVWEVKKQGVAFSGNPITNSTGYLDKQPSFTNLGLTGVELKYNVQKVGSKNNKIRTRVAYDKVTAITGQVYGPWRYPAGYTMGAHGMNSIPLPITLISFNGQFVNTDDVQLKWITTNEINMQSYFIERSTDGINFTTMGELTAKGIGSSRSDYSFTDKHVLHNLLYYRLRLKEKSGEVSYTKMITLSRSKTVNGFIAPNPVQRGNDVLLTIQSVTDKNLVSIQIYNLQGQLIVTENKTLQNGRNEITLSTNRLAKGIYVVNVLGDGVKQRYKLVVQ